MTNVENDEVARAEHLTAVAERLPTQTTREVLDVVLSRGSQHIHSDPEAQTLLGELAARIDRVSGKEVADAP